MSQRFNNYFRDYNHVPDKRALMLRTAGRLMIAILFDKPIIVIGTDYDNLEGEAREGELDVSLLERRFQNRTSVSKIDVPEFIPEEVRHWQNHPNYKNIDLRAAIESSHAAFGLPFLEHFGEFFEKVDELSWKVEHGQLVCIDKPGLQAAAREWLQAFRESPYYSAKEAAMNISRDLTTYIGFIENGVLDEHERTHTLKSAHLYFMRMFRWLPLPEASDGYALWRQTLEEDLGFPDEMSSDWPQVWPCGPVGHPDELFDRQFPIVKTDTNLGGFGQDVHGGYAFYLPEYVVAQYMFDC
ncbi:hypothetical protein BIZ82_gp005 [Erwinia phage vB_EamM_EarlPhillipIV]|uniref:Uncharacterized protein n=1 Tax=Erwinia phage vB_EamM_EarlPhillipIV TaxID=1883372 RepID=A0A1B2ICB4_9CAUD|nr:hypothetical protein BIZ82_gp005 [Erwinia phage vB_EamM_EarlPhillipIV]ANZ48855.1 hypothetical protein EARLPHILLIPIV_5 [Erwinia phage vB_EamM_EarlPhillipIV]